MAKIGRPPAANPRTKTHMVRLSDAEDEAVRDAAERDGIPPAVWIREKAVSAAKKKRPTGG